MSTSVIQTDFAHSEYGKSFVKLLALRREGSVHHITEVEVNTALTLDDNKDYVHGDNSDVVATDSQKNTVYILARKFGIENIESFAMRLCNHFLQTYHQFVHTHIYIKQYPWKRIGMNGREHIHAFILNPDVVRFCDVKQARQGQPIITAGITDLKILKTTSRLLRILWMMNTELSLMPRKGYFAQSSNQSGLTIPSTDLISPKLGVRLPFGRHPGLHILRMFRQKCHPIFSKRMIPSFEIKKTVKDSILAVFAGPPDTGRHSPCVQKTVYDSAQVILNNIPQIEEIQIVLPNVHHFQFDFSKFPRIDFKGSKNTVFVPSDKPSGVINATIKRREKSRL